MAFKKASETTAGEGGHKFVSFMDMHTSIGELGQEGGELPNGVWRLRAISLKHKVITYEDDDGEEQKDDKFTLTIEPMEPTASVDPVAVAEVNPKTGKPAYEGRRVFLSYTGRYGGQMSEMRKALLAFGFNAEPKGEVQRIIRENAVKGREVYGTVFTHTYPKKDGSEGIDMRVKDWAPLSTAAVDDDL